MKPTLFLIAIALSIACAVSAIAQDNTIGVTPDDMKLQETKSLGPIILLRGDPANSGPYVARLKVPPNDVSSPHTHRQAENITVISGWIGFGLGWVFEKSKGRVLPAGSFFYLPANTPHFAWTGPEGAVIQIHGVGPFP